MTRLLDAWRALTREQRRVALASFGLFVTMFLPWYSKTDTVVVKGAIKSTQESLNAFQAFSFVEAAVLLVSAGVLALLFGRAEKRNFNLPGGDGIIVTIAGGWAALLIFYRLLDKPGLQGNERITATVGVEWGIFVALLVALSLAYGGWRIHHAERPEMPVRRRSARAPGTAPPRRPTPPRPPWCRPPPRGAVGNDRHPPRQPLPRTARHARVRAIRPGRRSPSSCPSRTLRARPSSRSGESEVVV
jgi:hypothetical protein